MLLHRYSFNDGTARDSVGGAAWGGTLVGGPTVTGGQVAFGGGSRLNLPSGVFGNYTAMSVEAWVTTGASNPGWGSAIFQWGAGGDSSNSILVGNSGTGFVYFTWCRAVTCCSCNDQVTTIPFNSQTNMHVVVTVARGDYARLYINGALAATTPVVVDPLPPATVFRAGINMEGTAPLSGSLDELRIWGGALSASDVAMRYSQGPGEEKLILGSVLTECDETLIFVLL